LIACTKHVSVGGEYSQAVVTYYTGSTKNLRARMALHAAGKVKSTKWQAKTELKYYRLFLTFKEAFHEEARVKHLSPAEKGNLAREGLSLGLNRILREADQ
jgi:predicted GIY-YIG superfamily endonuclease